MKINNININDIARITGLLFVSLLAIILLVFPAVCQTEDLPEVPQLPMGLKGAIQVNDQSAPVGTIICAYIGDNFLGSTEIIEIGIYGQTPLELLVVNDPDDNNGLINFYVRTSSMPDDEYVLSPQTIEWESGKVKELDLSATYVEGTSDTVTRKRSSDSTTSTIITSSDASSTDEAVAGGFGDNTGTEPESTQTSPDVSSGTTEKSDNTKTIIMIFVIAIIIIVAVFYGISRSKNF